MDFFPTEKSPVYGVASIQKSSFGRLFLGTNFEQVLQHSLNELDEHMQQMPSAIATAGNEQQNKHYD